MRRKASDSATAAASAGGVGLAFANNRGQPIPMGRGASRGFSTSPRANGHPDSQAPHSASLGAAAEAMSLPAAVLNSGAKSGRPTGHTHFGQECYGPEPGENIPNPPPGSSTTSSGAPASAPNGGGGGQPAIVAAAAAAAAAASSSSSSSSSSVSGRRGSVSESVNGGDDEGSVSGRSGGKDLPIHRCESCNKVYRHPSCLVKHRWEHTVYWKEASKFLMSKHQQVQLLEAAAILVNMDGDSASLPDEKALWPAAVSPAASGLLGSQTHNFDRLMSRKAARRGRASSTASTATAGLDDNDGASVASSLPRSVSGGMSPLNGFAKMGLNSSSSGGGGSHSNTRRGSQSYSNSQSQLYSTPSFSSFGGSLGAHRLNNSDVAHLVLDESDERTTTTTEGHSSGSDDRTDSRDSRDRSGSAETTEDDDDEGEDEEEADASKSSEKKWGLHEDAVADMDMDE